ncbi:hypothetical protein CP532_4496 [Ophiocordyceps camponoti-leonardi (nom. inval.)]|nr:hypothetical protein CP532_4496 [Ophiocordyceps camponoti-leonardi (nom. inval.)]
MTRLKEFPPIWQRPSLSTLVETLEALELKPPSWEERRRRRRRRSSACHRQRRRRSSASASASASSIVGAKGVMEKETRYLATIIKSPLGWISDEDGERERVWELASKRMAERCGRTAMGDVVRPWAVGDTVELVIGEPGLTGDEALGLKTWASSFVLARHLTRLADVIGIGAGKELGPSPRVLELGAGTGLLGLSAAALWRTEVVASDLPRIVPNLEKNVEQNGAIIRARGGSVVVGSLTWGGGAEDDDALFGEPFQFDVVLAADPLYDDHHPRLLAMAIDGHLARRDRRWARAVVMVPKRDAATMRLLDDFRREMEGLNMVCCREEELLGRDDWGAVEDWEEEGDEEDEDREEEEVEEEGGNIVRCWLGLFSRSS